MDGVGSGIVALRLETIETGRFSHPLWVAQVRNRGLSSVGRGEMRSHVRIARWRGRRPRVAAGALAVLAVAAFFTTGAPASSQVVDLGDENSWLRIQNVGSTSSAVDIDFYDEDGDLVASDSCPRSGACEALRAGFGRSFFQQTLSSLPAGYRGSAYVSADQPFTALLARDVLRSDGEFQIAGDSLRLGPGAARHVLPWVVNSNAYVSRITVQNTSADDAACVQVAYYSQNSTTPVVTDPVSASSQCPSGGYHVPPRGSWVRDETSLPVSLGFDGSAIVLAQPTASGVPASSAQLQVMVDTRDRQQAGLASYRSIAQDESSRVVLLPVVDRNHTEGQSTYSTRFRISNANPSVPNEVTLLFKGQGSNGEAFEVEHTFTVFGSRTCDQRSSGAAACLPDGTSLPSSFSGTVRMQSVDTVGVVVQRISSDGSLADYRGLTAEEASTQVVLPVVNKNYGPFGGSQGWNSWFRVLTFDGGDANVYVVYYSQQFPDGLIPGAPSTVRGTLTVRQWENRQLPNGWVGSAVIVSDRPVVVVANLESDVFKGDPVMLYNGVSLE